MAVERVRLQESRNIRGTDTGKVPELRRDHFRLWKELEDPSLSPEARVDREAHLLWLDLSLGFVSPIEHKKALTSFYAKLEEDENHAALDYLSADILTPTSTLIPRMFEIRRRTMTDEQFSRIRAVMAR